MLWRRWRVGCVRRVWCRRTGSVKVNLNTATSTELQTLPRIGEAMAQRIIDYRDANGRFASIDDLRNITGIGDKTFEALKDLVTL